MGRGNESELSMSDADLAEAEAVVRSVLAPTGEPTRVAPPADLASRVLAALPHAADPPPRRAWWLAPLTGLATLTLLLLMVGGSLLWVGNPARLTTPGTNPLVLALAQFSQPLLSGLQQVGPALLLGLALVLGLLFAWQRFQR